MPDAAQLNAEQLEYWGGAGGERWVAQQARRDAQLGDFAKPALELAAVQPGEVVLDVGCGCGETTALLSEAVGPTGRVVAVDVSTPILAQARARLAGRTNVETILADAAAHPFAPASVDLVFSRFGVMFFGDPTAAFANIGRALKPHGRLVFVCWRSPAENGWMTEPFEAVKSLLPPAPRPDPEAPGPMSFGDPARVTRILTGAGFTAPEFTPVDKLMDISEGEGVEGAVQSASQLGPTARALDGQDDALKATVVEALRAYFQTRLENGAVALPAGVWTVSAKRA